MSLGEINVHFLILTSFMLLLVISISHEFDSFMSSIPTINAK